MSVLKRSSGMAFATRVLLAVVNALGGGFWGLVGGAFLAAIVDHAPNQQPRPLVGGMIAAAAGGMLGWFLGSLVVTWIEWAHQMLAAADDLVQR